jgi:hypothetical protein
MDDSIRASVATRASSRCEYCQIHSDDEAFTFHVEHIIALKHGGSSLLDNLAFACQHCNLHKGSNLAGIDPETGVITAMFHPREQSWKEHFSFDRFQIRGLTPAGRATVQVLAMNDSDRVQLRAMIGRSG